MDTETPVMVVWKAWMTETLLEAARLKMPYFVRPTRAQRTRNWFMYGDPNYPLNRYDGSGKVVWRRE